MILRKAYVKYYNKINILIVFEHIKIHTVSGWISAAQTSLWLKSGSYCHTETIETSSQGPGRRSHERSGFYWHLIA